MNEDFTALPSSPSTASFTSANSSIATEKTAPSGAVPQKSADLSIPDKESQLHFPIAKEGNNNSSMNLDPAVTSPDPTEHAILSEPSANTSRHINIDSLMNNEDDDLDSYNITKLRAAVLYADVKKINKTKKQCINRLENFLLDR